MAGGASTISASAFESEDACSGVTSTGTGAVNEGSGRAMVMVVRAGVGRATGHESEVRHGARDFGIRKRLAGSASSESNGRDGGL